MKRENVYNSEISMEGVKTGAPNLFAHVVKVTGPRTTLYLSGQESSDLAGEILSKGDIEGQIRQTFKNMEMVLKEAGGSMQDIVTMTIYLADIRNKKHADTLRRLKREYWTKENAPAMTTIQATLMDPKMLLEVTAVAEIEG